MTIAGVTVAGYNSSNGNTFPVTVLNNTTFTYVDANAGLAQVIGGIATATRYDTTNRSFQVQYHRRDQCRSAGAPAASAALPPSPSSATTPALTIILGDTIGRQGVTRHQSCL